jgi:hypothetical protein
MAVPTPRHVHRRHRHELLFFLFLLQRFQQCQPQFVPSTGLFRDGLQRHPSRVKRFQKRDLFERRVKQFSRLESLSEFLKRRHDALLSFFVRHHHPATLRELLATSGKTTTKKIGFYFFTYEWNRRRLSLIKMIHGVEEVLIVLFTAFGYKNLF